VAEYPFVESFQVDLVESLYRSGRRCDAIGAYHDFRTHMQDELGVDPSPGAQQLYLEMISCSGSSSAV
jgi:DNA-binding SARP family transcriptional activator